jgi:hypothetical protein
MFDKIMMNLIAFNLYTRGKLKSREQRVPGTDLVMIAAKPGEDVDSLLGRVETVSQYDAAHVAAQATVPADIRQEIKYRACLLQWAFPGSRLYLGVLSHP